MTTKELYIKHKSGDISNQKFLYEVRRDSNLPWITNVTSYEDAVKILKNKGIINEADGKKYGDVEVISKTIDMVNPYEYSKGMNYELDMADNPVRQDLDEEEVLAAQKKVLANITKDANYYTKLYAGLNPTAEVEGYKEIEIAGKNLEKGIKADMEGRKADGYIKKELKKDPKANVKDDLGKKEAGSKKPKGVSEFKDKGVKGTFKTIKEGIEEILKEKLAQKKANEAKVEEALKVGDKVKVNKNVSRFNKEAHGFSEGDIGVIVAIDNEKQRAQFKKRGSGAFSIALKALDPLNKSNNEAKVEEAFDLDATFKTSPSSHSYEDVLDIFTSYEDEGILSDFKANFPEGKDISKVDYLKFAILYIDDMSALSDIKANWISVTDPNVYKKAGLVEGEVEEHHNDPNFPGGPKIHALLDKVAEDWGKDSDLYSDLEDAIVGWSNRNGELSPKGILAVKALLSNWDSLEDYEQFLPEVKEESAADKMKKALKEKLKSDDKVKAIKEKKDKSLEEGALDNQIAALEKVVAQKKKETADAEKKVADMKAKEASAEANG